MTGISSSDDNSSNSRGEVQSSGRSSAPKAEYVETVMVNNSVLFSDSLMQSEIQQLSIYYTSLKKSHFNISVMYDVFQLTISTTSLIHIEHHFFFFFSSNSLFLFLFFLFFILLNLISFLFFFSSLFLIFVFDDITFFQGKCSLFRNFQMYMLVMIYRSAKRNVEKQRTSFNLFRYF